MVIGFLKKSLDKQLSCLHSFIKNDDHFVCVKISYINILIIGYFQWKGKKNEKILYWVYFI